MFETLKGLYKDHEYAVQIGGTVIGYLVGLGIMAKWAMKATTKAITAGINGSALVHRE